MAMAFAARVEQPRLVLNRDRPCLRAAIPGDRAARDRREFPLARMRPSASADETTQCTCGSASCSTASHVHSLITAGSQDALSTTLARKSLRAYLARLASVACALGLGLDSTRCSAFKAINSTPPM